MLRLHSNLAINRKWKLVLFNFLYHAHISIVLIKIIISGKCTPYVHKLSYREIFRFTDRQFVMSINWAFSLLLKFVFIVDSVGSIGIHPLKFRASFFYSAFPYKDVTLRGTICTNMDWTGHFICSSGSEKIFFLFAKKFLALGQFL